MWRYIALLSAVLLFSSPASAWVKYFQPLPEGEAVVIRDIFCRAEHCPGTQGRWRALIQSTADAWNAAGSRFHFAVQPARPFENFCEQYGLVVVTVADPGQLCPEDGHFIRFPGIVGRTAYRHNGAVVYLKNGPDTPYSWDTYASVLLHEFGHVLGLGHPNESGQSVPAIMNTPIVFASLQDDDIAGARALYGLAAAQTSPQVALEAPDEGQTLTGIGLLRGWACDAETVSVRIDGHRRIPISVGSPRGDTEEICGTADTGFALLLNWNNLGAGEHTLDLFINSRLYTTRTITVITYGQRYMTGMEKEWTITDWPEPGIDTIIAWNEATQNIEIVDIRRPEPPQDIALEKLLGAWHFQAGIVSPEGLLENRRSHFFTLTHLDTEDPQDEHAVGFLQYTSSSAARVYGERNTVRWFSQPLKEYEVYWVDGTQCHLYAFNAPKSGNTSIGYYWYGYGSDWDECRQDAHGPYTAFGTRND